MRNTLLSLLVLLIAFGSVKAYLVPLELLKDLTESEGNENMLKREESSEEPLFKEKRENAEFFERSIPSDTK
uniref:Uncharacterized protein n=1 Tax=Plectus sambesii TaxID=2011161 RepID=A0A914UNI9_9BILA